MRYSVQLRHRILVKGYGFLSFAKKMGKNIGKNISKILSGKYSKIIQKQLQMRMIKKYLKQDIYLQKKDKNY